MHRFLQANRRLDIGQIRHMIELIIHAHILKNCRIVQRMLFINNFGNPQADGARHFIAHQRETLMHIIAFNHQGNAAFPRRLAINDIGINKPGRNRNQMLQFLLADLIQYSCLAHRLPLFFCN